MSDLLLGANSGRQLRKAVRSALNKVVRQARTASGKTVRKVYGIRARDLKAYVRLRPATNRNLEAELILSGQTIPLHLFKPKEASDGTITVEVKLKERRTVKGGFRLKKLGDAAFIRRRKGVERFPLEWLRSVSAAKMYEAEGEEAFTDYINENLGRIINNELNFFLNR